MKVLGPQMCRNMQCFKNWEQAQKTGLAVDVRFDSFDDFNKNGSVQTCRKSQTYDLFRRLLILRGKRYVNVIWIWKWNKPKPQYK